jgi:hypothetical protein
LAVKAGEDRIFHDGNKKGNEIGEDTIADNMTSKKSNFFEVLRLSPISIPKKRCGRTSDNLIPDAEGTLVVVPIGAKEFEAANLGGGTDVLADARTHVEVANADKADGL